MNSNKYRNHLSNEISLKNIGKKVKVAGWVFRIREHSNLTFIDLKDNMGIVQILFDDSFKIKLKKLKLESVILVEGEVIKRDQTHINKNLESGEIEIKAIELTIESLSLNLPFNINIEQKIPEDLRLKNRFLDLRREKIHEKIILRSQIVSQIRKMMEKEGFIEIQTPILTSASPEGAKDFLVASSLHPGKFYALPQAPQQFKQLLMMSRFDKYFQIAPCFRDEASRADRSPGEFYQLDIEMSFVEQEDVFNVLEPIIYDLFKKFSTKKIHTYPFPRITYDQALEKYATDKPDLRNPIILSDVTNIFEKSSFELFKKQIFLGSKVKAIPAPKAVIKKSRKFPIYMEEFAKTESASGLGYIQISDGEFKGPLCKFLSKEQLESIKKQNNLLDGDMIFFLCEKGKKLFNIASKVRNEIGKELELIKEDEFAFAWITDFYLYELNEENGKIEFSHNPFSMPQIDIETLSKYKKHDKKLLDIKAFQYDIVCNGIELSSGAIRNHKIDLFYKLFNLIGYENSHVDENFPALSNALKYGPPPHGGIAPGIDRMIMLLTDEKNLREIIAFPMNQNAEDMLMQAPNNASKERLKELHLKIT
ncbi:MAG: aspartate--tRNA ligase [Rickettsia sp.]|nr:aspartate--tRNA ligase [Rickettsia sp.]